MTKHTSIISKIRKMLSVWPGRLALLITLLYMFRNSLIIYWVPGSGSKMMYGSYALLIICLLYISFNAKSIVVGGALLLVSWLPSVIAAVNESELLFRVIAICLLLVTLGPVIEGKISRQFRTCAWHVIRINTVLIGLLSAMWYVFDLPGYWKGSFTGVMTYAMLVGPFSALGSLFSVSQAIRKKSWVWLCVAIVCFMPTIASGSRLAVVSFAGALVFLLILQRREIKYFILAISVVSLGFVLALLFTMGQPSQESEITKILKQKGMSNTREELWQARIKEFKDNSLIGVGIGKAEGAGSAAGAEGGGTIEPGSSYLGILSMTGMLGTFAYIFLIVSMFTKWWERRSQIDLWKHAEYAAFAVFFGIHMIGEGWILAAGSPICFVYWLWVGNLHDMINTKSRVSNTIRRPRGNVQKRIPLSTRHGRF